jgi:tRNA G37 N-methylase TrmD
MNFTLYTLHPSIFQSFLESGLIARGISQSIIGVNTVNWRDKYGVGGYNQIDDKPYGGGTGMVLQPNQIYQSLVEHGGVSSLYKQPTKIIEHASYLPNNSRFINHWKQLKPRNVTISLTPRGHRYNQQCAQWLAESFDDIHILCGRYEGFDARISDCVDLEISMGDYVLNGGEVAAMSLIESVSRLVPGFVTKTTSILHDSFSTEQNLYQESSEFVIGKRNLHTVEKITPSESKFDNLFDDDTWIREILPHIEHPQYTRPEIWNNVCVPKVLIEGNHKLISHWQHKWWD